MVMRHLLLAFFVIMQSPFTISRNRNCPPERCGSFDPIPFPFHLNPSCQSLNSDAFLLSCSNNSTSLFLNIASQTYQVVHFFPYATGLLIDYLPPNTTSLSPSSSCRPDYMYSDLTSSSSIFNLHGNGNHNYYSISTDNILSLYDCNDSSVCKPQDCEKITGMCSHGCCYSLSDPSNWHIGDPLSVFSQFGCRGFSSWVVVSGNINVSPKLGVKLEWAVPSNLIQGACDPNAGIVNVTSGMMCQCLEGFVGDGFAQGVGCLKSCLKNGREAYGRDCDMNKHGTRRLVLLSGVLASAFSIASLTALFCLLKGHSKSDAFDDSDDQNACRGAHLFTYQELEEATKGFVDSQKLADMSKGTIFTGTLADGTHVAVQKVHCTSKSDLISRVELLHTVSHCHMARLLGCSIDSGLVVYEYPANGTLEQHLRQSRENKIGFEWHKRLNIASETASVLAFLQCEIIPPIFHNDVQSCCIFLDEDYSVKLAGFDLSDEVDLKKDDIITSDVYSMGVVLLEIIGGGRSGDLPTVALHKIRSGKLEEMVDPLLYYHEQPSLRREQIEAVADLGTRCLLFGQGGGKLRMNDVARELAHIRKDTSSIDGGGGSRSTRGPSLDETFSNSSLLQMISMSPDSIYHLP